MVSIFTGLGSGFERGSASVLGAAGLLGSGTVGRSGESASVNAATGNLVLTHRDEFLSGRGNDVATARTYNSRGDASDENGDNWRDGNDRRLTGVPATPNAAGASVTRVSADGAAITYSWNGSAYVAKDGGGAFDTLSYANGVWTWTDGDSRTTERYEQVKGSWRITAETDRSGNQISYGYTEGRLTRVAPADGEWIQYNWSGNRITQMVVNTTNADRNATATSIRTRYGYDAQGRLSTVTTDLTPDDASIADDATYVTTYTYVGTTTKVASIAQTDGSRIDIGYDASDRVTTYTETVGDGTVRTTGFTYDAGSTRVTDPVGQVTTLAYNADGSLSSVTAPPAAAGAAAQVTRFGYDGDGNLVSTTDPLGAVTTFGYDARGNQTASTDRTNANVTRTYDAGNRVLTETRTATGPSGSTLQTSRFAYDGVGRLRFTVSAAGTVQEYRYDRYGQQILAIGYSGQAFDLTGRAATAPVTEAELAGWTTGTNPADRRYTETAYDLRGNVVRTTDYSDTPQLTPYDEGLPIAVATGANTAVTSLGGGQYRITKNGGQGGAWDADARSIASLAGDFVIEVSPDQSTAIMMAGVSRDPKASASYTDIAYGFYFQNGQVFSAENNGNGGFLSNYAAGDRFWLVRSGNVIFYYKGSDYTAAVNAGPLLATAGASGALSFDCSIQASGASVDVIVQNAVTQLKSVAFGNTTNAAATLQSDGTYRIAKNELNAEPPIWNASARSAQAFAGDFVIRIKPSQINRFFMVGVSSSPDQSAGYQDIAHAFYFQDEGNYFAWENGGQVTPALGYYSTDDTFWLVRSGTTLTYAKGATLGAAMAAPALRTTAGVVGTLYVDSSILNDNASFSVAASVGKSTIESVPIKSVANTSIAPGADGLYRISKTGGVDGQADATASTDSLNADAILQIRPATPGKRFTATISGANYGGWMSIIADSNGQFTARWPASGSTESFGLGALAAGESFWLAGRQIFRGTTAQQAFQNGLIVTFPGVGYPQTLNVELLDRDGRVDVGFSPAIMDVKSSPIQARDGTVQALPSGGYLIQKSNSDSYSQKIVAYGSDSSGWFSDFLYKIQPKQTNGDMIVGSSFASNPQGSDTVIIDNGFRFDEYGNAYMYEERGTQYLIGPYQANDTFWIVRKGGTLSYLKGETLKTAVLLRALPRHYDYRFVATIRSLGAAVEVSQGPLSRLPTSRIYAGESVTMPESYSGATSTALEGRIGRSTYYSYDAAGQLLSRRTTPLGGTSDQVKASTGATLVAFDDFESGSASGWLMYANQYSYQGTPAPTATSSGTSTFAGRFGTGNSVGKTYQLDSSKNRTTINIDFYKIDGWEPWERLIVGVGGGSFTFAPQGDIAAGTFGGNQFAGSYTITYPGSEAQLGFGATTDGVYRIQIELEGSSSSVEVSLRSTLNEDVSNESFGIDNVTVTQSSVDTKVVATSLAGFTVPYGEPLNGEYRWDDNGYIALLPNQAEGIPVRRDFALDDSYPHTVVEFDFIPLRSWDDGEKLNVSTAYGSFSFMPKNYLGKGSASQSGYLSNQAGKYTVTSLGRADPYYDVYRVRLDVDTRGSLTVGLSTSLNQEQSDEAAGIQNFRVLQTRRAAQPQQIGTETFAYDGLGRVIASTDINGGTTRFAFGDAQTQTVVTLASGLVQTSTYDKTGRLLSTIEGGAFTTSGRSAYTYDARGLARSYTDATGHRSYFVYDRVGRKVGDVDHYGALTEYVYDRDDRIVTTIRRANLLTAAQLATLANPANQVDLDALRPPEESADIYQWKVYDAEGRVVEAIDGTGSAVAYTYDASGQLLKTTEYADRIRQGQLAAFGNGSLPITATTNTTSTQQADGTYRIVKTGGTGGSWDADASSTQALTGDFVVRLRPNQVDKVMMAGLSRAPRTSASFTDLNYAIYFEQNGALNYREGQAQGVLGAAYAAGENLWMVRTGRTLAFYRGATLAQAENTGALRIIDAVDGPLYFDSSLQTAGASIDVGFSTGRPRTIGSVVVPATTANGTAISRLFYDERGLMIGSLDGDGGLIRIVYDKMGLKLGETRFRIRVPMAARDSASFNELVAAVGTAPEDRTTRWIYDQLGQMRFMVAADGAMMEYVYDTGSAATALTTPRQTIAYATRPALSAYDYTSVNAVAAGLRAAADNRVSWTVYDAVGRASHNIDASGAVTGFVYDSAGRVVTSTRYATLRPTSQAPSQADMIAWTAAQRTTSDRTTRNFYDGRDHLRFMVDAEGYLTRYDYDAEGRQIATVRFDQPINADDYSTIASIASSTRSSFTATVTSYDMDGRLLDTFDGVGTRTTRSYAANGTMTSVTVAPGTADESVTSYTYDGAGRMVSEIRAAGRPEAMTTRYGYDGLGDLVTTTDPDGGVTRRSYDRSGRLLTETDALARVTTYRRNAFGEVTDVTDARQATTWSYYDQLGRVIATRNAENYVVETQYSVFGEILAVVRRANAATNTPAAETGPSYVADGARDAVTRFGYDRLGRAVSTTDAEGGVETYVLDAFGQRYSLTNKLGGQTVYGYDRRGLMVLENLPVTSYRNDGTLQAARTENWYSYDARGNRVSMVEAFGLAEQRTTNYAYDAADRLIRTDRLKINVGFNGYGNDAGGFITASDSMAYDRRGNVVQQTDANGARTLLYYDALGRKTAMIDAVGAYTGYAYSIHPGTGSTAIERRYDQLATVPTQAGGTAPTPPSGSYRQTTMVYDLLDRMVRTEVAGVYIGSVGAAGYAIAQGAIVTTVVYDAAGNLVQQIDGNGRAIYTYVDKLGRKVAQVDQAGYLTEWTLDADGNVLVERRAATATTGATVAVRPTAAGAAEDRYTDFLYDRLGRRTQESRRTVRAASIGAGGVLTESDGPSQINYEYNALGQVTRKVEATGEDVRHDYDVAGRLIRDKKIAYLDFNGTGVSPTVDYHYDGLGNLTRSIQTGSGTATNARVTRYEYGGGGRLRAMIDAMGLRHEYYYDAVGRKTTEMYLRINSYLSGNWEGTAFRYDAVGNLVSQWSGTQSGATIGEGSDVTILAYNAHREIATRYLRAAYEGDNQKVAQEQNVYDTGGRVVSTNAGDGVWRYYAYDGNGNRTLAIESAGAAIGGQSLGQLIDVVTANGTQQIGAQLVAGVNVTLTSYDPRNQVTQVNQAKREISLDPAEQPVDLVSRQSYNAFGETVADEDASGAVRKYTYNSMGRLLSIELPRANYQKSDGTAEIDAVKFQRFYYDLSGRMIGQDDANGNRTTWTLLPGSGYDGSEALRVYEWHPDRGVKLNAYDGFGDLRRSIDELGRVTAMAYDDLGRVNEVVQPGGLKTDRYWYDLFGNRVRRTTDYDGKTDAEYTDYDAQGRVIYNMTAAQETTTSYVWNRALVTGGLGSYGGYVRTTTIRSLPAATDGQRPLGQVAGQRTSIEKSDAFGHTLSTINLGGGQNDFGYDFGGRVVRRIGADETNYTYFNTGLVKRATLGTAGDYIQADYGYDRSLRKIREQSVRSDGTILRAASASYDILGRMTSWGDSSNFSPPASMSWSYDANGNITRIIATYSPLDGAGNPTAAMTQDYAYQYDAMNRVTLARGTLDISGGNRTVGRGANGINIAYDAAGQRRSVTRGAAGSEQREDYTYRADGVLQQIFVADALGNGGVLPAQGALRSSFDADGLGRVTWQRDYNPGDANPVFSRSVYYDAKGRVGGESSTTRQSDGSTVTASTSNYYGDGTTGWALNQALSSTTTSRVNNGQSVISQTSTSYAFFDAPVQSQVSYDPDVNDGRPADGISTYGYRGTGTLDSVAIQAGARSRTIRVVSDVLGQAIRREEVLTSDAGRKAIEVWYRFDGRQIGAVGNNGTLEVDEPTSIEQRRSAPLSQTNPGPYRGGASSSTAYANFDQFYEPLNSFSQGSSYASYTVRGGDTLARVAAQLWGDASLWYKLGQANGLTSSDAELTAGTTLTIPAGVVRTGNSAATFRPYDPADAYGDTSPTTPRPQAIPARRNRGCGVLGQILLVAVAVAVTIATHGAFAGFASSTLGLGATGGAVVGGALTGAAASIASQGVGLVTGIQDKFSWTGVALAALSGAVGGAVGPKAGIPGSKGLFGGVQSTIVRTGLQAATTSAISQGIGVAVGLQSSFSFSGVAAAGIASVAGGGIGRAIGAGDNFGGHLAVNTARGLANAATRSALDGTSFGDNLIAALPDVIGGTIGGLVGSQVSNSRGASGNAGGQPETDNESASRSADAAQPGDIIVTARAGNYVDYFPEVTAIQISLDMTVGGPAYAAARQKERVVQSLAAAANGASQGRPGYGAIDALDGRTDGSPDVGGYAITKAELAQRAAALAGGKYDDNVRSAVSLALAENDRLIDQWTATADAEVNRLLFVGLGGPAAIGLGGAGLGAYLAAGGGGLYATGNTLVAADYVQANVRGYTSGDFAQQSTVGGTLVNYLTGGRYGEGAYALGSFGISGALGARSLASSYFARATIAESGSAKFINQGFSPAQAEYLAEAYPLTAKGHHSLITQAMGRKYDLPKWIMDSPLNVLKPQGISRGDFYELHYKVDPYFFNANFPRAIGGSWRGSALGLEKYGTAGRIWYGSPTSLKVTVGGTGTAGVAGAYYYFGERK